MISDFGNPDAITFPWLNESSCEKEFVRPFDHFAYQISLEGKTVSKTSLWDVTEHVRSHSLYILDLSNVDWCGARGQRLKVMKHADKKAEMARAAMSKPLAFTYHRQIRSEKEYLASMVRGRAKFNRSGSAGKLLVGLPVRIRGSKVIYRQNNDKDPDIVIDSVKLATYHQSLNDFINECDIVEDLVIARTTKLAFAEKFSFENYGVEIINHLKVYCLSFHGTAQYPVLLEKVKSLGQENITLNHKVLETIKALKKEKIQIIGGKLHMI